ncbi:integrator complex subunit 5 [Onthophagus taurus]|uniref:integrator complex subunit 5 n=1 Tax=Onthophagus taurus TaxID=166361 RepID=UPI0039BDE552
MIPQQTLLKPPQYDLMNDFRNFIRGATKTGKCNPLDLTKIALSLLRNLPASRDAVLMHFSSVFDRAAENYIVATEQEITTGKLPPPSEIDEAIVSEIHTVLCNFVSGNAEAWAPIISTWSLDLLGRISTKYAGRAHISSGLNETLQLWMNCRATRTLIDITTQCLQCLMHSDTEACISALLDTSVEHSPNFDWVVAHVGSCFPNTVITRVLTCGLKDFCQNKSYEQGCNSPKLKSVVGILGHLANSHCDDIHIALRDLFKWSLMINGQDNDLTKQQKKATVPFLLHLSNLSSILLSTVCCNLKEIMSVERVRILYNFTDGWLKYFGSSNALQDLLVNLILKCEKGGSQIIKLLLDCTFLENTTTIDDEMKRNVKLASRDVLEFILQEIDFSLRFPSKNRQINLLKSLTEEIHNIHALLVSSESVKSQTAARILVFIGHSNPDLLIKSAKYLFKHAKSDQHLALLVRILTDELIDKTLQPYVNKGGYFSAVLEQVLNEFNQEYVFCEENFDDGEDQLQTWINLLILLKWEKTCKVQVLKSQIITRGLQYNLITFTSIFAKKNFPNTILHIMAETLEILNVPSYMVNGLSFSPPMQVILNFTNGIVNYFFICCKEADTVARLKGFERTIEILKKLCTHSNIARILALRELLEKSLFSNCKSLFGSIVKHRIENEQEKLLLKQNKKLSKTIPLTKHSSVYNGGIIGTGKRKSICSTNLLSNNISNNTEQLIRVIKSCCSIPMEPGKQTDVLQQSIVHVSLLLVHYVSPDVMYNGLPWPEEEFSKVTIERDLYINRLFTTTPLLWELLSMVAVYRPALCYCSVLIRALTATLIHQWSSMGDQSKSSHTDSYKSLIETTVKVVEVMSLGQLLPPPLSGIRDVIGYFNSFEIVAILRECIWAYMRDHIPSPTLFVADSNGLYWRDPTMSRPSEVYTNTLRIIMQRNIKSVGHLYAQMFINIAKNE